MHLVSVDKTRKYAMGTITIESPFTPRFSVIRCTEFSAFRVNVSIEISSYVARILFDLTKLSRTPTILIRASAAGCGAQEPCCKILPGTVYSYDTMVKWVQNCRSKEKGRFSWLLDQLVTKKRCCDKPVVRGNHAEPHHRMYHSTEPHRKIYDM